MTKKLLTIFGAGANGIKLKKALSIFNIKVDYFIDNNPKKHGTYIEGIKIISAEELKNLSINNKVKVISAVATMYENEIRHQISNYDVEYTSIPQWLISPGFYLSEIDDEDEIKIEKVKSLLTEKMSRKVFNNLLNYRKNGDLSIIKEVYTNHSFQYIEKEIIDYSKIHIAVDAGAFDGDSAILFFENMSSLKKVYSFEPDRDNFLKLEKMINNNNMRCKIISVDKGLGEKEENLKFSNGYEVGSYVDLENGSVECSITSIDSYFKDKEKVDFIKMDIEGFEKEALIGAKETIKKNKPALAICLYHKPTDLWELPLLINEILPEYKLYIRHYSLGLTETVLYATILDRLY